MRDPRRRSREIAALRHAGYRVRASGQGDRLRLWLSRSDEELLWQRLRVDFPPSYPWSDPEVSLSRRALRRHGRPLRHVRPDTGGLCLVADAPDADHDPTELVATLLARQLPKLRAANDSNLTAQALAELEELVPLNQRTWAVTRADEVIVLDPSLDPGGAHGWALVPPGSLAGRWVPLLVRAFLDEADTVSVPDHLPADPSGLDRVPWVRLDRPLDPLTDQPGRLWRELNGGQRDRPLCRDVVQQHLLVRVRDEISYRHLGWSWLYLTRTRTHDTAGGRWRQPVFGRVQYAGAGVQAIRTPCSRHLEDKAVLLVGAGALGSVLAMHLVRAGLGAIAIIDPKTVQAAAAARQYCVLHAGCDKASLLGLMLLVKPDLALRAVVREDVLAYSAAGLTRLLQQADLVVDATANRAASRYLAVQARQHRLPWLSVAATAGAYGGWVACLPPNGPCHCCLEHARADGCLPAPPADPHGLVQPERCLTFTFTGTAHDLAPLAALAARTVSTLLTPDAALPAQVLTYDSGLSNQLLPSWTRTELLPHPRCVTHARPPLPHLEPL